jgi:hypothetical protein
MLNKIILFSALAFSPLLWADSYDLQQWQLSPTLGYETNSLGNFTNAGLKWGAHSHHHQYVELVSNLSMFQPANQFSADTSFTNLDVAVRFGVFSQINLYAELGVALDELFVDGRSSYYDDEYDDGYYYNDNYQDSSRPDWFVGVGAGWRLDWLSVNLYARYRYLESLEEQFLQHNFDPYQKIPDRYQWFTGLELSVHF